MKKFVILGIILTITAFSVFANGWVNAREEIAKSVAENSPKSFTVADEMATPMISSNFGKVSRVGSSAKTKCNSDDTYAATIEFWSANAVREILEGKKNHERLFKGLIYYTGSTDTSFVRPKKMDLGTYTITDYGTYDMQLAFLTVETNATLTITVDDKGRLVDKNGDTMKSEHGFYFLNDALKAVFLNLKNGVITGSNLQKKALFAEPKSFSSPTASCEIEPNTTHSVPFTILSWWLRAIVKRDTKAGIYTDNITITVLAKPDF